MPCARRGTSRGNLSSFWRNEEFFDQEKLLLSGLGGARVLFRASCAQPAEGGQRFTKHTQGRNCQAETTLLPRSGGSQSLPVAVALPWAPWWQRQPPAHQAEALSRSVL